MPSWALVTHFWYQVGGLATLIDYFNQDNLMHNLESVPYILTNKYWLVPVAKDIIINSYKYNVFWHRKEPTCALMHVCVWSELFSLKHPNTNEQEHLVLSKVRFWNVVHFSKCGLFFKRHCGTHGYTHNWASSCPGIWRVCEWWHLIQGVLQPCTQCS